MQSMIDQIFLISSLQQEIGKRAWIFCWGASPEIISPLSQLLLIRHKDGQHYTLNLPSIYSQLPIVMEGCYTSSMYFYWISIMISQRTLAKKKQFWQTYLLVYKLILLTVDFYGCISILKISIFMKKKLTICDFSRFLSRRKQPQFSDKQTSYFYYKVRTLRSTNDPCLQKRQATSAIAEKSQSLTKSARHFSSILSKTLRLYFLFWMIPQDYSPVIYKQSWVFQFIFF